MRAMVIVLALCLGAAGCAGTQISGAKKRSYIVMDVTPPDALIYVDGDFMGAVDGWAAQTVVVEPGVYMIELRATGHISQRFDLSIARDEEVRLTLRMEPILEDDLGEGEPDP